MSPPMPMQIDELITAAEVAVEAITKRRDKTHAERKFLLETALREGRSNLSAEEETQIDELKEREALIARELEGAERQLRAAQELKTEEQERATKEADQPEVAIARPQMRDGLARVGTEERTYRPDNDSVAAVKRLGGEFLRDVARGFLGDYTAQERLARHMAEERIERGPYLQRAVGTGAFAGLTVPQYLTDLYAPAVANLRPFANICNSHPLPADGMSVNISRITTATSAALQATENTAVSETNIDDTLLTENIQTVGAQQTLSRQAIDRGTGVEAVVMDDLFRRYATVLDSTLITQATTGLSAVAAATSFTTAAPDFMSTTAANSLYGKILGASSGVEAALLAYGYPTHAVMHSRRWAWINSKVNSVWPGIAQPSIPVQAGGLNTAAGYDAGIRGILPNGLGVVVDNNISTALGTATNEDEVYIVPSSECHLWEDSNAPAFIRADQPAAASLGVLLVLWGYFAYSFRRYTNGMGKVSGTGLTTPTF